MDNRQELINKAMSRGMSEIEASIYADRFEYIRRESGYARAYQMFIQELIAK